MEQIYSFAKKWIKKFQEADVSYLDLVEHYMADDCEALGFVMDCGHGFSEQYGRAAHDGKVLRSVIGEVTDIQLLGSAIYSRWRYFNHWAYSGEEITEPHNREWFVTALTRLAELAEGNPFLFQGKLQKMKLVSNNICYGPCPEPDDEIEQRLTVNAAGRVWYSTYCFGSEPGKYQLAQKQVYRVDAGKASKILSALESYFSQDQLMVDATDIGSWDLVLTNTAGATFCYHGALCSDLVIDDTDISDLIRDALGKDDLYAFDGGPDE